jgi:diguanylate cyclase (GGDEF)-like protein
MMLFQIVQAIGCSVYFVFFLLFLGASRVPRTNPGAGWWALAMAAACLSRLALWTFTAQDVAEHAMTVYAFFLVLEKLSLMLGAVSFFGSRLSQYWIWALAALAQGWVLFRFLAEPAYWLFLSGLTVFNILALLIVINTIWQSQLKLPTSIRLICISGCALLALHWSLFVPIAVWVYPAWQDQAMVLGTVLVLMQYLALLSAVFMLFQKRLLDSEARALAMAYQDPLTGLSNKRYVDVLFEQALLLANRPHQCLALLYIDLDKFKPINDSAGHQIGDLVLKEIARRLKASLRSTDICARVGGDEFVVIVTQLENEQCVVDIAEKLLKQLQLPVSIAQNQYQLGASIGISLHPKHGQQLAELLEKADQAMYRVKQQSRNSYQVYREL